MIFIIMDSSANYFLDKAAHCPKGHYVVVEKQFKLRLQMIILLMRQ